MLTIPLLMVHTMLDLHLFYSALYLTPTCHHNCYCHFVLHMHYCSTLLSYSWYSVFHFQNLLMLLYYNRPYFHMHFCTNNVDYYPHHLMPLHRIFHFHLNSLLLVHLLFSSSCLTLFAIMFSVSFYYSFLPSLIFLFMIFVFLFLPISLISSFSFYISIFILFCICFQVHFCYAKTSAIY